MTSVNIAEQLFKLFLEILPKVFIIIDGLDECEISQRKLLLSSLTKQVDHWDERETGKLRIMFVSQQLADIDKALSTATVFSLSQLDNESDIKLFVETWCNKIQSKHELDMNHVEYIRDSTLIRSEGAFNFNIKPDLQHMQISETLHLTEMDIHAKAPLCLRYHFQLSYLEADNFKFKACSSTQNWSWITYITKKHETISSKKSVNTDFPKSSKKRK